MKVSASMDAGHSNNRRRMYRIFLLILTMVFSLIAQVVPIASRQSTLPLQVGDVATVDIISPQTVTYQSDVLTEKARQEAANSVAPIYLPADPAINREQLARLNNALDFINSVRNDAYSSLEQKIADLGKLSYLSLTPEEAVKILELSEERWLVIQDESLRVLELIMRDNIRDNQISEKIKSLPGLINYSLSSEENEIVQILVTPLIVPNSLFSSEETEKARELARSQIAPVQKTYAQNQAIVLRGQIITPEQYEALVKLELIRPEKKTEDLIAAFALILVLTLFIVLYFSHRKNSSLQDLRSLTVIAITFILFLVSAKVLIPNRAIIPFFFPLPAFALIMAALFPMELSLIFPIILSILVTHGVTTSAELPVFYVLTSLIGGIILGRAKNIVSFIWAALGISVAGILVITAYRLPNPATDMVGLITLYGASVLNGFASASLALLLQFVLSQLLGLTTPMYLTELSRSDHPLLKHILQSAPGTYQHSLQVANLAEQAATAIGADALLTRVGAYYHDAGKSQNSAFFIENQVPGFIDSHENLDPVIAAQTIIEHVHDGIKLADKYHLPPRLKDFIREHHGAQITRYQYGRALEQNKNNPDLVDKELFRYPGPNPRSKETAILMLADISEARVRSNPPKNEEEMQALLKDVFDLVMREGSLDNTNLTFKDLKTIQESFKKTLMNSYHPRIQYPEVHTSTSGSKK